ncbi:YncE family protein [Pseudonocardia sp. RS11V-5]|uniref:YncE family protein n=1 Tax=Pseudonocardia terrae TaxID=2905831 RepID=UPI001E5AC46A|nr:YncE family protein [Pseudonocardia terrae]MCE3555461.1 YncE family protein [Pseudonocardia terrae]
MASLEPDRTTPRSSRRGRRWLLVVGALVVAVAVAVAVLDLTSSPAAPMSPLPLRPAGETALPGDSSRFDYASLDADRGLLFIAHLGASEVIEFDTNAHRVVRTIPNLSQVHGVLVVPTQHRVYATATGANQMVTLNEDTGEVLARAPTGEYPDGLAYDPRRDTIWTTNETGGSETIINATSGQVRGTIALGGEVGNVAYDYDSDRMLVAVQGMNDLVAITPDTLKVTRQLSLPGCEHDHGLAVDPDAQLAFVACDGNAVLLTVDMRTWQVLGTSPVGKDPDVVAYDRNAHRLYVAAESGTLAVLDLAGRQLTLVGLDHVADGAHIVAVDPNTHHSYYPIPVGSDGRPALLERVPV